jgi:putative ABC transport system permease protein
VISYALWQELGSDPAVVGKSLRLGGIARRVIGVMPRTFWFPSPTTRVWNSTPLDSNNRSGRYALVGRAAPGVPIARMEGPLRAIAAELGSTYRYPAQWDKTKAPSITALREFLVGDVTPSVKATLAAMAVILLIACANVAALMLGQVDAQATELAVRSALGADRRRLIQQLVFEALLIGALAGLAGAVVAAGGFSVLVGALPLGDLAEGTQLDWSIFWASGTAALGAAALIALVPGVSLWRGGLQTTMAAKRTGGISARGGRLEGSLVIAQMALAVLLAAGAGLLVRSVLNLKSINPGFDVRGVVIVDATMPTGLDMAERRRTILDMLSRLQAVPGVRTAAATQKLPLRGSGDNFGIRIKGKPEAGGTTAFRTVSREYLNAIGVPLLRGRGFLSTDREDSDRVVIINQALAAKYFPNEDPIGHVIQTFDQTGERIIGVVGNAAEASLTDAPVPARYVLYEQMRAFISEGVSFVLKADAPQRAPALLETARETIRSDGRELAIQKTSTMPELFDLALGATGQVVTLLGVLAGLALVLGAIGVYGVMSHSVTRRSRDYGICLALGETPGRVVRQVVMRATALVGAGGLLGILAALMMTKLLAVFLYGVEPTDPLALGAAVGVLLIVGVLAALVPARRASRTDPAFVLRQP